MVPIRIVLPSLLAVGAVSLGTYRPVDETAVTVPEVASEVICHPQPPMDEPVPMVEVAILLDTSNSMDGLIDQARTRLWSIVRDLSAATKHGRAPDIRVALYEYGKSSLHVESSWIRQVQPLTQDLDAVSESLFALQTNGGDEYCGAVIARSLQDLQWTAGDHYRAVFIAGNEAFTQGPVDYRSVTERAIEKGIVINTIHCGDDREGRDGQWDMAARITRGQFFNINQNRAEVSIPAPQDDRIRELNDRLNSTYIHFGAGGAEKHKRQMAQDANAAAMAPSALAERVAVKSSAAYCSVEWDLVEATEEGVVELETVAEEVLPEEMKGMDADERKIYVEQRQAERVEIQNELQALTKERREWVEGERAQRGLDNSDTFGAAVRGSVREQMLERGFEIEQE